MIDYQGHSRMSSTSKSPLGGFHNPNTLLIKIATNEPPTKPADIIINTKISPTKHT